MLEGYEKDADDLPGAYERSVEYADALADRRFDHAEAAGRLAEVERLVANLERRIVTSDEEQARLRKRGKGDQRRLGCPVARHPVRGARSERMLAWLDDRDAILQGVSDAARPKPTSRRSARGNAIRESPVADELVALGANPQGLQSLSLAELIDAALEHTACTRPGTRNVHASSWSATRRARSSSAGRGSLPSLPRPGLRGGNAGAQPLPTSAFAPMSRQRLLRRSSRSSSGHVRSRLASPRSGKPLQGPFVPCGFRVLCREDG